MAEKIEGAIKELHGPPAHVNLEPGMHFFFEDPTKINDAKKNPEFSLPDNFTAQGRIFNGEPDEEEVYTPVTVFKMKQISEYDGKIKETDRIPIDIIKGLKITNLSKIYVRSGEIRNKIQRSLRLEREKKDRFQKTGKSWAKRYRSPLPKDDQ
ncbi:hypothetical protein FJZ41_02820 [Candidatus Shapirobacteria bacterium]|nr:hypothetical protein [Candidatus Shapirobacteria bacterium]